ncbi:Wzz/FepE/Etk N-terminal domain-containing protein [Mucilaginibacter sp. NFX135]|uniref:Wzz/FepE/Etk N-terminal domain-containing protein n=1 Tax=Mucilaginibacter sp. NFX135 TaxID=3402687 RepID=UPI003AFB42E9
MDKPETTEPDELSLKDVLLKYKLVVKYLKTKILIIAVFGVLGGALGLTYAFIKKPVYTATCTFVLDEGKAGGGLSQVAGLASLAGIDLGGATGGGGVFQGDNIMELYKSRNMIEKVLLSEITVNNNKQLLIDRYIKVLGLRRKWKQDDIDTINFQGASGSFSRKQDSIITDIAKTINKKVLKISKPDKKLTIIEVDISFVDEIFAKEFNDKLVTTVNDFYIKTKTKKTLTNVNILQRQADSVKNVLNNSLGGVASSIDAIPNANPLQTILKVPSQRKQIDVQASSAIYAEIVKNLELSKITLRQEAPLIQVIDNPVLPLVVTKIGKIAAAIIGLFLGAFLTSLVLATKKLFGN